MDAEHTPGPWIVDKTKAFGPYNIITANRDWPQRKCIVCSFNAASGLWDRDRPRVEADANLIAAAPDLLAACEYAAKKTGEMKEHYYLSGTLADDLDAVTNTLEAAVAKARGEGST